MLVNFHNNCNRIHGQRLIKEKVEEKNQNKEIPALAEWLS